MPDRVANLEIKVNSQSVLKATQDLERLKMASKTAGNSTEGMGRSAQTASQGLNRYGQSASKAARSTKFLERDIHVTSKGLTAIAKRAFAATAGFVVFNKAQQAVAASFRVTAELEKIGKQFEFVSGSASAASEDLEFVRGVAEETGQVFLDLAATFPKLQYAFEQAGIAADDTRKLFEATNAAAATFGLSQAEVNGVLRAFVQVASKGKVQAEEIRGQIGERLPGAFGMAAKSMGMTTAEFSKQLELGNVYAKDMIPALASAMDEAFGGDMANKTDTLTAKMNDLKNTWVELNEALRAGGVFEFGLAVMSEALEGFRMTVETFTGTPFEQEMDKIAEAAKRGRIAFDFLTPGENSMGAAFQVLDENLDQISSLVDQMDEVKENSKKKKRYRTTDKDIENEVKGIQDEIDALWRRNSLIGEYIDKLEEANRLEKTMAEQKPVNDLMAASAAAGRGLGAAQRAIRSQGEAMEERRAFDALSTQEQINTLTERKLDLEKMITTQSMSAGELNEEALSLLEDHEKILVEIYRLEQKANKERGGGLNNLEELKRKYESVMSSLPTTLSELKQEFFDSSMAIRSYAEQSIDVTEEQAQSATNRLREMYEKNVQEIKESQRDQLIASDAWASGVITLTQGIEDAMVNAAVNGKASFNDMAQFILAELYRIFVRASILQPLFAGIGGMFPGGSALGSAFLKAGGVTASAVGGYVPSGTTSIVGEMGPEVVNGPAVVSSTKSTRDKLSAMGSGGNNFTFNVAQGVRPDTIRELRSMVSTLGGQINQVNRSVEPRALAAVGREFSRNPNYARR